MKARDASLTLHASRSRSRAPNYTTTNRGGITARRNALKENLAELLEHHVRSGNTERDRDCFTCS